MGSKKIKNRKPYPKLFINWLLGTFLVFLTFYVAVAWLWQASEEAYVSSLKNNVISALSGDLAEGNIFKLGVTLSRFQNQKYIHYAQIGQIKNGNYILIYKTNTIKYEQEIKNLKFWVFWVCCA